MKLFSLFLGKLLLVNGNNQNIRDEAKLMSPVLKANNGSCKVTTSVDSPKVSFWYFAIFSHLVTNEVSWGWFYPAFPCSQKCEEVMKGPIHTPLFSYEGIQFDSSVWIFGPMASSYWFNVPCESIKSPRFKKMLLSDHEGSDIEKVLFDMWYV